MKILLIISMLFIAACSNQSKDNLPSPSNNHDVTTDLDISKLNINELNVSQDPLEFGVLTSQSQLSLLSLNLVNPTNAPINLLISLDTSLGYTIKTNRCSDHLSAKSSCQIMIEFNARGLYNNTYPGSIEINSTSILMNAKIQNVPSPYLEGSPVLNYAFKSDSYNSADPSPKRVLVVSNQGTAISNEFKIPFLSDDFSVFINRCPKSLLPKQSCEITLFYKNYRTSSPIEGYLISSIKDLSNQVSTISFNLFSGIASPYMPTYEAEFGEFPPNSKIDPCSGSIVVSKPLDRCKTQFGETVGVELCASFTAPTQTYKSPQGEVSDPINKGHNIYSCQEGSELRTFARRECDIDFHDDLISSCIEDTFTAHYTDFPDVGPACSGTQTVSRQIDGCQRDYDHADVALTKCSNLELTRINKSLADEKDFSILHGSERRLCPEGGTVYSYVSFTRVCDAGFVDNGAECMIPWALAAGPANTCAINSSGFQYCWGASGYGQVITETNTEYSSSAVRLGGYLSSATASSVALGFYQTCTVVKTNSQAYCWGYQDGNQAFGTSGLGNDLGTHYGPIGPVVNLTHVSKIDSGGYYHTCAIDNGNPYCWGYNGAGAIGSTSSSQTPVALDLNTQGIPSGATTNISTGWQLTCFIANEKGYCLGYGREGQVGNGLGSDYNVVPQKLSGLENKKVTDIAAAFGACAVADSQAYCWGNNLSGQLGIGAIGNPLIDYQPKLVPQLVGGLLSGKKVSAITMGGLGGGNGASTYAFTCAIANGQAYCWGDNNFGQLGIGSTGSGSNVPAEVNTSGVLNNKFLVSIKAGNTHACARDVAGDVYCWGQNNAGQFGNGTSGGNSGFPVKATSFVP